MRKFVFLYCLLSQYVWSQTNLSADALFEKFEYPSAITGYQKLASQKKLSLKQYKNLAYATFSVGDFQKAFELTDSIMKTTSVEPFFEYANGYSAFALGKYEIANQRFSSYKQREKNHDLDSLLASIKYIELWNKKPMEGLQVLGMNTRKAESTQGLWKKNTIILIESGINTEFKKDNDKDLSQSEFLFKTPYLMQPDGKLFPVRFLNNPLEYPTFNSFSIAENNDVVCNISGYSKNGKYFHPQNYLGKMMNDSVVGELALFPLNDSLYSNSICINSLGNLIILSAKSALKKDADLFQVEKINNTWTQPQRIVNLSTMGHEVFPVFTGDSILSFSSDGRMGYGGLDIYQTSLPFISNRKITHLPFPINGPSDDFGLVSLNKDSLWFTSNRYGGTGDDDLYAYTEFRPSEPQKDTIPKDTSKVMSIKNLLFSFDFDSYTVKNTPDSLERLISFFNTLENHQILLVGKTDVIGSEEYNAYLGEMRAKSVAKLLVSKGVESDKIKVVSKGEKDPVIRCNPCSELMNSQNRIVNLDIIKP
ncbi:MAG: hypothetical protein RLZZ68_240 [Bacteroidota bacterium]|jgi:outer membrane protein OmpA-like peptidoglycan-associated protein